MELPVVSALEFEQLKSSIKTYIKSKTDFKDYDFEGSNLSMLVDILAYNTLYTSYNVNMSVNELNLDTAVLRDNIVSISKRLGYNPNSYTSAKIRLDITVNNIQNYDSVKILPGDILATTSNGVNYKFINRDVLKLDVRGKSSVVFQNVELLEGIEYSITYTVDESNEHQRFFIPNNYVDSETIRAFVISDPSSNVEEEYERRKTIVDVSAGSKIFFVEEVQDQKYEIIFGDDNFGRKLRTGEVIRLQYVVSSGSQANNLRVFDFIGSIAGIANNVENLISLSDITGSLIDEFSDGGSEFESIRSIKYAAPRKFASQDRAVTLSDYEVLTRKFYPNADLVNVVGGESLNPPIFGQVFISIKPIVGERVSSGEKERIKRELKKYQVGSITANIVDPDQLNVVIRPNIFYDITKTRKTLSDIKSLVNTEILNYIKDPAFNSFGGLYSNSELIYRIKDLENSIKYVNILTYLQKEVDLSPIRSKYVVEFFTKLKTTTKSDYYVMSDPFCHAGYASPVFLGAFGNCNYSGSLNLCSIDGTILQTNVGTVNESTGRVEFLITPCQDTPINITVIPDVIEIVAGPQTTPNLIVSEIDINSDNYEESLNPDNNVLPVNDILSKDASGDPNTNFDSQTDLIVVESPDGNTYLIPKPTPAVGGALPIQLPGGFDNQPTITPDPNDPTGGTDPNNIITIDDFIPEIDPTVCS